MKLTARVKFNQILRKASCTKVFCVAFMWLQFVIAIKNCQHFMKSFFADFLLLLLVFVFLVILAPKLLIKCHKLSVGVNLYKSVFCWDLNFFGERLLVLGKAAHKMSVKLTVRFNFTNIL